MRLSHLTWLRAIPLPLLGLLAAGFLALCFWLLHAIDKQERLGRRLNSVSNPNAAALDVRKRETRAVGLFHTIAAFGSALARSGLLPAATRAEFEQTLAQAGLRGGQGLGLFVGSKVVLVALLPAMAYLVVSGGNTSKITFYAVLGTAFAAGLLAPDFILKQMRNRHLKACERGLPDALDMLVICAQAGLALEHAIERVATEFAAANKAVSQELAACANELRIGSDRRRALLALGERTGLDTMKRFAATLIQTMQFGTPLTQALRVLASEMRTDNLTKFEEKAAKLPVILTLPMILFILPTVFIIVGGPAGVRISKMFNKY